MLSRRTLLLGAAAARPAFFHKGVNFTAEQPDRYASDAAVRLMLSLRDYGVNSVAFVPYGFTPRNQPVVRFDGSRVWERDDDLTRMAEIAHRNGLRVFLKPQLWVGGGWPGDLEFPREADREAWFRSYRPYLEHYSRLAAVIQADVFCVGCEFTKLSRNAAAWRSLIALARRNYAGPLTYAATQGVEFESVEFWDALDYIGLNNYYPLPDTLDVSASAAKVEAVQRRFGKPVIFPEAGFSSMENAHREPWAENSRRVSMEAQTRGYEAVCRAFFGKPWFHGVYWWKIGSNGAGGLQDRSHTPWRKPAMEVIRRYYSVARSAPSKRG